MPIYEFYCADCNTIFQFLSRSLGASRMPNCPRCGRTDLEREASLFAVTGKAKEEDAGEDLPLDEARMMEAMAAMESEAGALDEDDPRQAAAFMRKFFDASGMPRNDAMEEAMRRMEAGEDPDQVEADLGDALDPENLFATPKQALNALRRLRGPRRDPQLYDL